MEKETGQGVCISAGT